MGSLNDPQRTELRYIQQLFDDRVESTPSEKLIFYPLGNTARKLSSVIHSLDGFRAGCPVLLHLNDHWDTILWFWAVLFANGLPAISPIFSNVAHHRFKQIEGLSNILDSPICITRAESLPSFDGPHSMQLQTVEALLNQDTELNEIVPSLKQHYRYTDATNQSDSPAILMFSSGSTGCAKAVALTHKQILASIAGKASVRPLPANRPFLNWIGLDHVASLVEIHLQAMWVGVSQVHLQAADVVCSPMIFLDLLSRHRVSRSFAPNFFLAKMVSAAQTSVDTNPEKWDLSSLAVLASGGEANDVKTCVSASALLETYGAPRNVITPGFGMTETCAGAIFSLHCPDYDIERGHIMASLGKCMKGLEMRITQTPDEDAYEVTLALPGELGNLEVRGDVVFTGYYHNAEATAEAFTSDDWFRTGDQASIDSLGNLNFVGRSKDVININGVKMVVADIQASIEQAVGSRVARLVCFPSRAVHTEQVTVSYIPKDWRISAATLLEVEDLTIQACIISTGARPNVFALSEKSLSLLPTSALGKISQAKMRSLFEEGVFDEDVKIYQQELEDAKSSKRDSESSERREEANEAESRLIGDFQKTLSLRTVSETIDVDTNVFDLGFTSMDLIRLKHHIDVRLGTSVPVIMLMKNPTARLLAAAIDAELLKPSATVDSDYKYDPVVTFRSTGTKTPLWLVHPGVGEVLVFVGLVQQLHLVDGDRPIYALRAKGFEQGQVCFDSIDQAVDTYVDAIRRQQPRGPYALAGYSYGAMLAFQMAKKLDAKSDAAGKVRFLGSFNLPPHIKSRMRQLKWNMCLLHLTQFLELTTEAYADSLDEESFASVRRSEALEQVLGVADRSRLTELGLGEVQLARWADVAYSLQSMAVDYEPDGSVEVIDIFHAVPLKVAAATREEWMRDHLSRWSEFCLTDPRFHEVEGAHYTMLAPDHVVSFAARLAAALRARGI
ncbi:acyl-protein synthetase [Mollisia scopiformis]|uniref:Acyl-protein synthetase n=1 Tax=Mollisia scopiformis TaxID=149040 RepID=A0A194XFD6_MOLSC|nr:acyl-protein synthetase [Mollisia scopiformis]KUJ18482.1 acyl-protein synthetase [Mollisia scopiformis]